MADQNPTVPEQGERRFSPEHYERLTAHQDPWRKFSSAGGSWPDFQQESPEQAAAISEALRLWNEDPPFPALLEGADLQGAQLEGAHLKGANLERATFFKANLQHADLAFSHLEGAHLAWFLFTTELDLSTAAAGRAASWALEALFADLSARSRSRTTPTT